VQFVVVKLLLLLPAPFFPFCYIVFHDELDLHPVLQCSVTLLVQTDRLPISWLDCRSSYNHPQFVLICVCIILLGHQWTASTKDKCTLSAWLAVDACITQWCQGMRSWVHGCMGLCQ
jgi:hypothetical protein